jgi:hypothetical protein
MTRESAEKMYRIYQEAGAISALIPLITAIRSVEYYREKEGK